MGATVGQLQAGLADRYRIERGLGRGGMATVYLAHDLRHDRPIALKVLHPELAATVGPERFEREIKTAARLQHPHILPVHDSGETAGQLWYTMPYVRGESLRDRLRLERQLAIEDALQITREVADALSYAHEQGIIHRDIKPENVLLSRGHALVADFGLARAIQTVGKDQLTETGISVGTPTYMSPEQSTADPILDGRSDLYSLGCVLYEMLTGETPYTGRSAQAIITRRLTEPVPSARTLRETVPLSIDEALQRALAKAPADRFPTALAFAQVLSGSAETQSTSIFSGQTTSSSRIPWKGTTILAGLGLCVLLLFTGLAYYSRPPTHESPERKMLAVLPFKNLGEDNDRYFADGLTEEITARLAALGGLGVISRTSANRYRDVNKSIREIARELGANYILEGSVRWEKLGNGRSRVRVTPQLIQVNDDSHLWADRIDADLADVFSVQTQIAEQVSTALGVKLGSAEQQALLNKPTANLTAYDAYLRGRAADEQAFTGGSDKIVGALQTAIGHYEEAVQLDPSFSLAWARLGMAHVWLANWGADPKTSEVAAHSAITKAIELTPELSDAHSAEGAYRYFINHDPRGTLVELERARKARPNDAEVVAMMGTMEWVIYGPKGRAIEFAERAVKMDPQSNMPALRLAWLYINTGKLDQAERLYDRVIGRDSVHAVAHIQKAYVHLLRDGDTLAARAIIRGASRRVDSTTLITAAMTGLPTWGALGMLDEAYQSLMLRLTAKAFAYDTVWYGLAKGYAYRHHGDVAASQALFDTAQQVAERHLKLRPNDTGAWNALTWTYAQAHRLPDAYKAADRYKEVLGFGYMSGDGALRARMAVFAGDYERALSQLETREWGSDVTIPWLCVDHFWDRLRTQPRFQRIVGNCRPGTTRQGS